MARAASRSEETATEDHVTIIPNEIILSNFNGLKGSKANGSERTIIEAFHSSLIESVEANLLTERLQFASTLLLSLSSPERHEYSLRTESFAGSPLRRDLAQFIRAVIDGDEEYLAEAVSKHVLSALDTAGEGDKMSDSRFGAVEVSSSSDSDVDFVSLSSVVVDVICDMAANIYSRFTPDEVSRWSSKFLNPIELAAKEDKLSALGYRKTEREVAVEARENAAVEAANDSSAPATSPAAATAAALEPAPDRVAEI